MFFTLDTAKQDLRRRSYAEAMSDSSIASDSEPYRPPLIMPDEEVIAMFVVPAPPQVQEKKIQTIETQGVHQIPEGWTPTRNSATFFTAMDEEYLGIICYPNGEVSAVVPTRTGKLTAKDFTPELDYKIAKSLVNESVTGVDRSTLPCVQYQKCAVLQGELVPECSLALDNNKLFDKKKPTKWTSVPLTCYCMEPLVKGYSSEKQVPKEVIKCTKCKDQYHKDCLSEHNKIPMKKKDYKCPPCSTETSGTYWGAGEVVSTCTLDNLTTGIALHTEQYGDGFVQSLEGTHAKEVLKEVSNLTLIGDFAAAQQSWYNGVVCAKQFEEIEKIRSENSEIRKSNKLSQSEGDTGVKVKSLPEFRQSSLHGSTTEMTYGHLTEAFTFRASGTCNYGKCPNKEMETDVRGFHLVHAKQIKDFPQFKEKCDFCRHGERVMELTIPREDAVSKERIPPPSIAHFDLEGSKPEDTMTLTDPEKTPNEIRIDGYLYRKQMITFHNPASGEGHFVSAQQYKNDWLWYDGIQTPTLPRTHKRLRKITPDGS